MDKQFLNGCEANDISNIRFFIDLNTCLSWLNIKCLIFRYNIRSFNPLKFTINNFLFLIMLSTLIN